ncbi:MAG: PD40 domain-containing protein [Balneola sp.]|nr:PD40 domain-containing protein [Balneola sp.]
MKKVLSILILFFSLGINSVYSQTSPLYYDYSHNHLEWFTIEGEHFLIHFQERNSRSAKVTARIAEEIYKPITELYQYEPDQKVSIVLKDRDDYSNGAAYFFDNKIDIWLPALDTPLRGTHNWLRNVITHEFTHIVQIQKAIKGKRKYPISYIQWLSYEDVRRPDVLYGFPNGIATLPFASINVPAWLAEGTAQYQREGLFYETWDSHRDMILRTRILTDTYFSLEEMGTFSSKTSIERETVYNQGFAFVIYLVDRFGEEVVREISAALAQRGVYDVAEAIEIATGNPGKSVFEDWIQERKEFYGNAASEINETKSEYVEKDGFFNFYPKISPDGNSIAYLSNKGRDFGLASLYLKDKNGTREIAQVSNQLFDEHQQHTSATEKPLITFLATSYSFSPDGKNIAYSVNKATRYGESYRDIFIYDLETEEHTKLTNGARIESPTWNTDGSRIVAIKYNKGTQNLVILNPETKEIQDLTNYKNGETLYTPVWSPDGEQIYFAYADRGNRSIFAYDITSETIAPIVEDNFADSRDPMISDDGKHLFYSGDEDGIFNIYRLNLKTGTKTQLTNVLGGAFMPFLGSNGDLFYSEYESDGYKIKKLSIDSSNNEYISYNPSFKDLDADTYYDSDTFSQLNNFNDNDLSEFNASEHAIADTGSYAFEINTVGGENDYTYREYEDTFTDFSFFPIIRFDNYTKLNGSNGSLIKNGKFGKLGENLLRDVKPGMYFASRDVLDKLSIFGGAMLGVGSLPAESIGGFFKPNRLFELDRDLFLIAEYRGLPFIKRSWSPTVSLELYNLRRNVKDGLQIEEFPCTSCAQKDTVNVDIAYQIWEANLYFRSKLSRRSLLELGIGYSPYRVETDNFYSNELQSFITGSSSEYFKGTTLSASYTVDYYEFTTDADIAPTGLKGYLRYQYQPGKLLEEYDIEDGSLIPIFKTSKNHSTEFHVRYGFKLPSGQALQARARGFAYFNNPNDSFYTDYIGGFLGMRSYPYFALGGDRTAFTSLSYFLPIFKKITKQAGPYTFDKLYARVFFEAGNAWNSPFGTSNSLKTGIGTELRLAMNGYYLFPLKFFVSASYGFNEFQLTLPDEFVTGTGNNSVTYGRELLFHFGLTFDFELL